MHAAIFFSQMPTERLGRIRYSKEVGMVEACSDSATIQLVVSCHAL